MSRLLLLLISASLFGQIPYTFRKVIDNAPGSGLSQSLPFFAGYMTLNDKGAVAFTGTAGGKIVAFYVSPGGTLTQIGGQVAMVQALNNNGTVLYKDGRELKAWSDGTNRTVFTPTGGENVIGASSINDQGTAAWATTYRVLRRTTTGPVEEVVSDSEVPRKNVFIAPYLWGASINSAGDIAFSVMGPATCEDCVYKKAGGQLVQISGERRPSGRSTVGSSGTPTILESGDVVYQKVRSESTTGYGYYKGNGTTSQTLIDMTNSDITQDEDTASINEKGQIAFLGSPNVAGYPTRAIYTGPDPITDRVIAIGDSLFGQRIVAMETGGLLSGRRINNNGEILFLYTLANGVTGLAIAKATTDPVITKVDAEFMGKTGASTAMYLQVKGANLSNTTRIWAASDFNGSNAPTVLDGVRATVGGKAAVVEYVSPTQVNIIVPEDTVTGPVNVQLTTPGGTTNTTTVTRGRVSPALLTTSSFLISGQQHVVAQTPNFSTFIGTPEMIPGVAFQRAKPGDSVVIFALGLGPTSPPTSPSVVAAQNAPIASNIQVRIGGQIAQVPFAGAVAGAIGLYQLNVIIPNVAAGNRPFEVTVDGVSHAQNLVIAVGP